MATAASTPSASALTGSCTFAHPAWQHLELILCKKLDKNIRCTFAAFGRAVFLAKMNARLHKVIASLSNGFANLCHLMAIRQSCKLRC